jgi:hypothetical protein
MVVGAAAASERRYVMLHRRKASPGDRWRIAALISMMLCFGFLLLWLERPGELYRFQREGTEYSLRADFGRLLVVRWSGPGGLNLLWNLPLWPFVVVTAALPAWVLWKFGAYRPKQPRGFAVDQKHSS